MNTQSAGAQQKHVPRFVVEPGWPKPGPRNWLTDRLVTEEMGATCTDAKGHVVSLNRGNMLPIEKSLTLSAAPPIVEFDPSGNVVKAWGDRSVLPEGLHGCLFDHENNFWLGGSGDGIVQKWTRDGSKMLHADRDQGKMRRARWQMRQSGVEREPYAPESAGRHRGGPDERRHLHRRRVRQPPHRRVRSKRSVPASMGFGRYGSRSVLTARRRPSSLCRAQPRAPVRVRSRQRQNSGVRPDGQA